MAKIFKYEFDPFEIAGVSRPKGETKERILEKVSDYVLEEVLSFVGDGVSPVAGQGKFKALSNEYKKKKKADGSSPVPNLELEGDLLDALTVKKNKKGNLELFVDDPDQQGKVDGHNDFTGRSPLPRRAFIPSDDEGFKAKIEKTIKSIVLDELESDGEV
jgi:hypothetical protein